MPTLLPSIEVVPALPYPDAPASPDGDPITPRRNRYRIVLFAAVFLLGCLAGLGYTFLRAPVYQSKATLLIAPPSAFDDSDTADKTQYLAVQQQVLTSESLLSRLHQHLAQENPPSDTLPETVPALRSLLSTATLPDAQMLELRAQGPQQDYLPRIVNAWIALYLETQAAAQTNESGSTRTALERQLAELEPKLVDKRRELAGFRERYDIVSMERNESEVLARLRGLTENLNKASQDEVTTQSRLEALNAALAQGKPVLRAQDRAELAALEERAGDLRDRLAQYEQRYTRQYMVLDPGMMAQMRTLERIEAKIRTLRQDGQQIALAQAEQERDSARQAVRTLQQQLDTYKRTAREFTTRFAEHQALQEELAQMEKLHKNVKEHLLEQQTVNAYKAPQVTVLSEGSLADAPIYPHYLRDAAISLAGSALLGLLAVLLFELLYRAPRSAPRPELRTAYFYPLPEARIFSQPGASRNLLDEQPPAPALSHTLPRELGPEEVQALLDTADPAGYLLIALLLSGLEMAEIAALRWQHIDWAGDRIAVPGPQGRSIPLSEPVKAALLRQPPAEPTAAVLQQQGRPLDSAELTALLACLAHDAGLSRSTEVTPPVLRHTYLAFLVRQGVRLTELERIAGALSPTVLAQYGALSPVGRKVSLDQIERLYPALRTAALS